MDSERLKKLNSARDSRHGNPENPGDKSSEYPEEGNFKNFIGKRNSEYPGKRNSENSESGSSDYPEEGNTTDLGDGKSADLEEVNSKDLKKENSKDPQEGNFVVSKTGNSENPGKVSPGDLKECSLRTHTCTAAMTRQVLQQRQQVVEKRPSDQSNEVDYDGRRKIQRVDWKDGHSNIATAQELSIHQNKVYGNQTIAIIGCGLFNSWLADDVLKI